MIYKKIKNIIASVHDICETMELAVDFNEIDSQSLAQVFDDDLKGFLCQLALADDVVVMAEIKFINELLGLDYNLLDIKRVGKDYDDMGEYIVPQIVSFACECNNHEEFHDIGLAEAIVNAFYYIGIEFISCDDDVDENEIVVLTETITNYQKYLVDSGIDVDPYRIYEDLEKKDYIKKKGSGQVVVEKKKPVQKVDKEALDDRISSMIVELNKKGYDRIRNNMLVLINNLRIRKIRKKRGLKNTEFPKTILLFGGSENEIRNTANMLSELFHLEGLTEEGFTTEFSCHDQGEEMDRINSIKKSLEMTHNGNMLLLQANYLSKGEVDEIIHAVKTNDNQAIFLSGDTNRLISFLEHNRNMNQRFNRSMYLDGIDENVICDIFEYLCNENDYMLDKSAKESVRKHFKGNTDKVDPFYIFEVFDRVVEKQSIRISNEPEIDETSMITINKNDVEDSIL